MTQYSIAKLAGLLIKTLSKPLSKRIKHEFSKSTTGSQLLQNVGQLSHNITSRMTIWSAGYKVRNIQVLPDDKALQIGSELVGESFVLVVSAGVVIYEYQRGKQKELEKSQALHRAAQEQRDEIQSQINQLLSRIVSLEEHQQTMKQQQQQQQQVVAKERDDADSPLPSTITTNPTTTHRLFSWWWWK
jgi:optic atrophy 3 protein